MAKLTKNRMSITSLDRISPMFFDGPYDGTVPVSSDGIIYNERCVDPDIEHVASGAYRERCVDPELEDNYYQVGNNRFSKRRVSRSRKTSKQMKKESPYRASTSSSDLERAMVDNGLHISGSETDDSETSSSPGGLYCSPNRGTSPIVESPSSDRLTITGDSKSYQSFGSYSSSKTPRPGSYRIRPSISSSRASSSVYSSARSKASETSSTSATGSFTGLRARNGSRTSRSSKEKRMGHVWSDPESEPTLDDVLSSSAQKTDFDVDWSVFEREAEQSTLSAEDFLPPPPPPPLPIFTNPSIGDQDDPFKKEEDSIFGSLPSTPTDVTSLWDDLPGDASEAFKDMDFEPRTQRTITPSALTNLEDNPHNNLIIEESRMTIKKVVVGADGVRETFTHAIEWNNELILFEKPEVGRCTPPPPPPVPPPIEEENKSVASVESYSSDEENVFESEKTNDSGLSEPVKLTPRESTSRLLTDSTEEDPTSPVSNLQQFFSPFLNPAVGPLSSTDTLNEEDEGSDSDSTLTRSPSASSSSSTATSARDENPFYDDCPYDTGIVVTKLLCVFTYSFRISSRKSDIVVKPLQLISNPCLPAF